LLKISSSLTFGPPAIITGTSPHASTTVLNVSALPVYCVLIISAPNSTPILAECLTSLAYSSGFSF